MASDEQGPTGDHLRLHIGIAVGIIVLAAVLTALSEITAGNW